MSRIISFSLAAVVFWSGAASADSFRYPQARHGRGELRYMNGVPVLILTGSPEEMGEQMGVLAIKPAEKALALIDQFLQDEGLSRFKPLLAGIGERLLMRCPDEYRRELNAAASAARIDRRLLVIGNMFHDLRKSFGCAALMVAPERSLTGGALMGRNLDYGLVPGMHDFSLVMVHRPTGKKPFVTVSFPGTSLLGCAMSSMNADGLVLGANDVEGAADGSRAVDLKNTPTAVLARRMLEECTTVSEAARVLHFDKPASRSIFVMCDRSGGAAVEATPSTVALRRDQQGLCLATNHYLSKELCIQDDCPRARALAKVSPRKKLGVRDVVRLLDRAHEYDWTVHALVFEPGTLKIHVAFGDGYRSATKFPFREVDLAPLLRP